MRFEMPNSVSKKNEGVRQAEGGTHEELANSSLSHFVSQHPPVNTGAVGACRVPVKLAKAERHGLSDRALAALLQAQVLLRLVLS